MPFVLVSIVGVIIFYNLPSVQTRLGWRVAAFQAEIQYALSPPEQVVFTPQQKGTANLSTTPPTLLPTSTSILPVANLPMRTPIPLPAIIPTLSATPLPNETYLNGVKHEYQTWNNCGPANLSMALSYWGWQGNQRDIATFTKPNPLDKNVMPYEMADYIDAGTDFNVIVRVGGNSELIKSFIAAGFPVIIEKGFEGSGFDGWMGHYALVTGYDNVEGIFIIQDSFISPDMVMSYDQVESYWRAFNYTYLVVYPPKREAEVMALLGPQIDKVQNYQFAANLASDEIYFLSGRDQFFAWFNRGTNLVALQDYAGAATAYDQAFAIYPDIPEKERPWRMMWYQTGPYWAYFYTGRYVDVINLATNTLDAMSDPILEESYYWRAMAREALGDFSGSIEDLQTSLEYHPGFEPSIFQLERLGVN